MNVQATNTKHAKFTVSKTDELSPEELEAQAAELAEKARLARINTEKEKAVRLEQTRVQDLETRENLIREVSKLEFVEKGTTDPDKRADIYTKILKYKADIDEIEQKYAINVEQELIAEAKPRKFFGVSTTKALVILVAGFFIFAALSYSVGKLAAADPTNASAQTILNTFWLRLLINFVLTFASFLVGSLIMYLFFPDAFSIWHNRVKTKQSISNLIEESPSWVVLAFISFSLALPIWVFVKLFEVIFI